MAPRAPLRNADGVRSPPHPPYPLRHRQREDTLLRWRASAHLLAAERHDDRETAVRAVAVQLQRFTTMAALVAAYLADRRATARDDARRSAPRDEPTGRAFRRRLVCDAAFWRRLQQLVAAHGAGGDPR